MFAEFDTKCSVLITKRLQSSDEAYKDALDKISQCNKYDICLLYTSPSPRDGLLSRMPSSA